MSTSKAAALGIDLTKKAWIDQHKFDRGRRVFIVEHMTTVSSLRESCMAAADEAGVLSVLTEKVRVVWILREENDRLTALGYKSKRPATAYDEAGIQIWED